MAENTMEGVIVFFDPLKNFGFIKPTNGSPDVWFSGRATSEPVERNDRVDFTLAQSGRRSAHRVYVRAREDITYVGGD